MRITENCIEKNRGKQAGYSVYFLSPDELENWHGEQRGVPLKYSTVTPSEIVALSKNFRCKSVETIHTPNMSTRAAVFVHIKRV